MIARIIIPILLIALLTYGYLYKTYVRRRRWWVQALFFLWVGALLAEVVYAARWPDYFPDSMGELETCIHVLVAGLAVPALIALGSALGRRFRRQRRGEIAGSALALALLGAYVYGMTAGFSQLEVKHMELAFSDLPEAFDGYRIVQFSDAHVGTYVGCRESILRRAVDSIKAQEADLVVFTGDLQNKRADEIVPYRRLLGSIKAPDGVLAVLGNHDYSLYTAASEEAKDSLLQRTEEEIRLLGWTLLKNENRIVRRGEDSIVVAGMENDGEGRFPQLGDMQKTMSGVDPRAFVVMLEHDPRSWRRKILPEGTAQLTLSGHTHGGQFSILGLTPAAVIYSECEGLYTEGARMLYVSRGLGGVIALRLGTPGEIVVITLRKK